MGSEMCIRDSHRYKTNTSTIHIYATGGLRHGQLQAIMCRPATRNMSFALSHRGTSAIGAGALYGVGSYRWPEAENTLPLHSRHIRESIVQHGKAPASFHVILPMRLHTGSWVTLSRNTSCHQLKKSGLVLHRHMYYLRGTTCVILRIGFRTGANQDAFAPSPVNYQPLCE